jgi:Protein of unknown function (DUF4238)
MATNKNQHFVPRCHLRPFTKDEGGAAINVFNLDRQRFIANAPVKSQCSGDYFYGKDQLLEKAIQTVEGAYGAVLRSVRQPGCQITEGHKTVLRQFWLLQYLRTEAASRRAVEMAAETDKVAGTDSFSFRFDIRQAVQLAMRVYAEMMSVVDDLKVCVVRNRSAVPLVTSDDPAVLTNRWYLEDRRIVGRSFGLQASGLLALLPLTPRLMCVIYDGDVYSIQHDSGWVDIRSVGDIRAINQHQFLNCFANVFVHDLAYSNEVRSALATAGPRRLKSRHAIHIAVLDKSIGDYSRYRVVSPDEARDSEALLHSESLFPEPTAWPSFLRWRNGGSVYTNGTGVKYVRRQFALALQSERDFWREAAR